MELKNKILELTKGDDWNYIRNNTSEVSELFYQISNFEIDNDLALNLILDALSILARNHIHTRHHLAKLLLESELDD